MSQRADRRLGDGFANLFGASLVSNLGDGIVRTAIPLLAARLTDDPLLIAGVAALAMLPWLLFAIPAGIAVDRVDRRRALAGAQAVRVGLTILLIALVAGDLLTIWWLYLVIFFYGAFETLYDGAVRSIPPSIVDSAQLPRANGRLEAGEWVMQSFVAQPFTSLTFAISRLFPLVVNLIGFAAAGIMALLLPEHAKGTSSSPQELVPWYRQLADGWRFLRGNRMLMTMWLTSTGMAVAAQLAVASMVLFVLGPLGIPEAWFGVFMLSGAVGGIAGSMAANRLQQRFGAGPVMAASTVITGTATVAIGVFPHPIAAATCYALLSATVVIWNVLAISLRQTVIPRALFGRVQGTWRTLLWGAMPLGAVLGGLVARIDLAIPFIVGGSLTLAIGLVFFGFYAGLPDVADVVGSAATSEPV